MENLPTNEDDTLQHLVVGKIKDEMREAGTFRKHVFGERRHLSEEEYLRRKEQLLVSYAHVENQIPLVTEESLREMIEGTTEAARERMKEILTRQHEERQPVRPMPVRILGETETRFMSTAVLPRPRAIKRILNRSTRLDKKLRKRELQMDEIVILDEGSIVLKVAKAIVIGCCRFKFVHRHKGRKKLKRGNPFRHR